MNTNHVSRFGGINVRTIVAVCTVVLTAGCSPFGSTRVTLKDGKHTKLIQCGVSPFHIRIVGSGC